MIDQPPPKHLHSLLVISHMYPSESHKTSGIFVHDQVKMLRRYGIDARVLTGGAAYCTSNPIKMIRMIKAWQRSPSIWDKYDTVPVLRFPHIVLNSFSLRYHAECYTLGASRYIKSIQKSLSAFPFQLIHAHTSFLDGSAAKKLAATYTVPYIITEHTGPFDVITRTPHIKKKTKQAMSASAHLIAVSQALADDMQQKIKSISPIKYSIIPNLVDTDTFNVTPIPSKREVIDILWVGHFVPIKRVPVLLEAMSIALKCNPNLRLKLVGEGEGLLESKRLCRHLKLSNYVTFFGQATRHDLPKMYSESDFLVISSALETFGVVAIEALSCGRPVLTTCCGGPEGIITEPALGQIVGVSAVSLAKGILDMAKRKKAFNAEYIRTRAQERFSSDQVYKQLKNIYDSVLN